MDGHSLINRWQCLLGLVIAAAFVSERPVLAQVSGPTQTASPSPSGKAPHTGGEQTPAWSAALQRQGQRRIDYAYDLASRGAIHSAQHELLSVLGAVAQTLDTDRGARKHSQALLAAQTALDEAADFLRATSQGAQRRSVAVIVSAHRTQVLSESDAQSATPIVAMQLYFSHAVKQFAIAAGGQEIAAEALFGLGRVAALMREHPLTRESEQSQLTDQKMLVYYQAAWTVDPRHYRAANEYGVLLARFQQWEQACQAFEYSVAQHAEVQNTRNLAFAYQQIGEQQLAQQATQLSRTLGSQNGAAEPITSGSSDGGVAPAVEWVDVQTFSERGTPAGWNTQPPGTRPVTQLGDVSTSGSNRSGGNVNAAAGAREKSPAEKGIISNRGLDRLKSIFARD